MEQKQTNTAVEETKSTQATWYKKFTSRKFIMALIGVITGICGMIGFSDNTTAVIAFIAIEVLSLAGYIIAEGVVDAKAVKTGAAILQEIADIIAALIDHKEPTVNPDGGTHEDTMKDLDE